MRLFPDQLSLSGPARSLKNPERISEIGGQNLKSSGSTYTGGIQNATQGQGMNNQLGKIHNTDCVAGMQALPQGSVDLVFADPPFNIGYKYDVYDDKRKADEYLQWSRDWMSAVHQVLKPDGTFWLAIGDDFAAELKLEALKVGFHCRSWVIWYYTFGVNCKYKFTRSHTHLFYLVKDQKKFTFRSQELENRIPSARMLVYGDKRGNAAGRLPDDTWIIPPEVSPTFALRPQDLQECFQPQESDWYFPRVAGTFKERAGFHGCQMPEQLLGRIIRTCSEEQEIVLDPFAGSASTLVVAKKLNRRFVGFELSEKYAAAGSLRLDETQVGDALTGAPEPSMSAPATWQGRSNANARQAQQQVVQEQSPANSAPPPAAPAAIAPTSAVAPVAADDQPLEQRIAEAIHAGLLAAWQSLNSKESVAVTLQNAQKRDAFTKECRRLGIPGTTASLKARLIRVLQDQNASQQALF